MALRLLLISLLFGALFQLFSGFWILAKAELAQVLIAGAWARTSPALPWPWADTWPVARLRVPALDVEQYVLEGASGQALAFGPGRLTESAAPGEPGVLVIAGHRDTHFRFLNKLEKGSTVYLDRPTANTVAYVVTDTRVLDSRRQPLWVTGDALLLVTCYPFDAVATGGPLRYIVTARPQATILGDW